MNIKDVSKKAYEFMDDLLEQEFEMYKVYDNCDRLVGMYEYQLNNFYELEEFLKHTWKYLKYQLDDDVLEDQEKSKAEELINNIEKILKEVYTFEHLKFANELVEKAINNSYEGNWVEEIEPKYDIEQITEEIAKDKRVCEVQWNGNEIDLLIYTKYLKMKDEENDED